MLKLYMYTTVQNRENWQTVDMKAYIPVLKGDYPLLSFSEFNTER